MSSRPDRPDRPLVVKCTFDRWNKRVTFSSSRNCTYILLREKIQQCFSLYSTPYMIAYKDDDGEVTDITNETDLTEAIHYFQVGGDDPPLSSAASILSGRSFGNRKITLRVQITVDYDGPSLSDTSSLISLDEYKGRNGSQGSFSFSVVPSVEPDDDSVTVSSRDTGGSATGRSASSPSATQRAGSSKPSPKVPSSLSKCSSSWSELSREKLSLGSMASGNPFKDETSSAAIRYPEDPEAVFERLRLEEEEDGKSFVSQDNIGATDRGAAWLREQNERHIMTTLGALPEPSISDGSSLSFGEGEPVEQLGGDLSLRRAPSGRYYYSYTSAGSFSIDNAPESISEVPNGVLDEASYNGEVLVENPRPTSMQLSWLASQQKPVPPKLDKTASSSRLIAYSHISDPLPHEHSHDFDPNIPPELLQFLPLNPPPQEILTDCSSCGVMLDAIRYVCSTCGEKEPPAQIAFGKGKSPEPEPEPPSYPPQLKGINSSQPSVSKVDWSPTLVGRILRPLPSFPMLTSNGSSSTLAASTTNSNSSHESEHEHSQVRAKGYELCSGCLESSGWLHAIESGNIEIGSSPNSSPVEDQLASSHWRRSAPKRKGQLRHAYKEKVWGHNGWEDVEQEWNGGKCSTCHTVILKRRYKCASCPKTNLCKACYSQVHEIHPSHAFLLVPDLPARTRSEPEVYTRGPVDPNDEQSMTHPGVKCNHCLLDIVGARFHCAICDSVDICSNCESAGLPGNLDSSDGGHNSSHIMIKIPYPLENTELKTASRRAIHLWTGRDAASVGLEKSPPRSRSKPGSDVSLYDRTVVGAGRSSRSHDNNGSDDDHGVICNGCDKLIIGVRYQCACCVSAPKPYSLCATCELKSYIIHDPMHIFLKFKRRVHRPLELPYPVVPVLYRVPTGSQGVHSTADPRDYLKTLFHPSAVCDRCVTRIQGEWFRCAYCPKDLCENCEELDTHDENHAFLVFKSLVDMQSFKNFSDFENPDAPPIIPFPVYR